MELEKQKKIYNLQTHLVHFAYEKREMCAEIVDRLRRFKRVGGEITSGRMPLNFRQPPTPLMYFWKFAIMYGCSLTLSEYLREPEEIIPRLHPQMEPSNYFP